MGDNRQKCGTELSCETCPIANSNASPAIKTAMGIVAEYAGQKTAEMAANNAPEELIGRFMAETLLTLSGNPGFPTEFIEPMADAAILREQGECTG